MVRSDSGDVDSSINIGYKNLVTGRNIGNGVLFGSGELIGGSQREDDYDKLINRMKEMNIPLENLDWYTNLRRFGGCYHAGFGLGFERLIMYLTGIENIRDVIPYPRTPNNCDY